MPIPHKDTTVANTPHIVSKVNGMLIPLLPHQGGILHRFTNPENQILISKVSEEAMTVKDTDERMVIQESEPSDGVPAQGKKKAAGGVL